MSVTSIVANQQNLLLVPRGLAESGASIVAKINAQLGQTDWQTGSGGGGEANTGANVGSTAAGTAGLFKDKNGVTLRFRRLVPGANVTLTEGADDITIAAAGGGSGATNLSLTRNATSVTVASSSGDDATIPAADSSAGVMTAADRTKLNGIEAGAEVNVNADWNASSGDAQILNKPTLGTAAPLNVALAGNASASEVVKGDDTRLSDARTPTSHTHPASQISDASAAGQAMLTAASATAQTALLDTVTSGAKGLAPASGGGTTNFLRADGTWAAPPGASGGEANTASNVGTTGAGTAGVFKDKSGVDLRMRRLVQGSNVTITEGADDITIAAAAGSGEANTGANVGSTAAGTAGVFRDKTSTTLNFKRLVAGSNVTLTDGADDITIAATGGGSMTGAEIATALQGDALTEIPSLSISDSVTRPNATYSVLRINRAVSTPDVTATEIYRFTLAAGEAFGAHVLLTSLVADRTGSNIRAHHITGYRPVAGSANANATAQFGATSSGTSSGAFSVTTDGNDVVFRVTGVAGVNYRHFLDITLMRFNP